MLGHPHRHCVRIPNDTLMSGYIVDAEHVSIVGTLVRHTKSEQGIGMLANWRRVLDRMPFVVLAGRMERRNAGVVGGWAASWELAMELVRFVSIRFDGIAAANGQDFSTVWFAMLSPEREVQLAALLAQIQRVEGSA